MIHFIIGTKAQFIKMAPLMHLLEAERRSYHLLDLGQHTDTTRRILEDFALAPSITRLRAGGGNVENYLQAIRWLSAGGTRLLQPRARLLQTCFRGETGVSLIHGDTVSTWLGLHLSRRAGLPVGLVEAGLSSGSLLDPFPEELIRRHAEQRADLLFAPDPQAATRLRGLGLRGEVHDTGYNTGRDALALVVRKYGLATPPADAGRYSVLTLHRLETLSRRSLLSKAMGYAMELAQHIGPVRFYVHGPTRLALARAGLLETLQRHPDFTLGPLLPYPDFVHQILHCRYLLTDGGSIQEEASYIGKPCLILRQRTERQNGIGRNVRLASYEAQSDLAFLRESAGKGQIPLDFELHASRRLLQDLMRQS